MQNLLDPHQSEPKLVIHTTGGFWKRMSRMKKLISAILAVLSILALALALWVVVNIGAAKKVYAEALAGKQNFLTAQTAIADQDFQKATNQLDEAHGHFSTAEKNFSRFSILKIVPFAATQVKAVENLLAAGKNLSSGLRGLAELGANVTDVIAEKDGDVSFADIGTEEKRLILQKLSESPVELQSVKSDIAVAVLLLEAIPKDGLITQIQDAIQPIRQQLPLLEGVITQAIPAAQSLPTILGYPEEKTYLFLLQNNRELRPAGGFIGTYGIVKLHNGEITSFDTDNIYNIDNVGKDVVTEAPPTPILQHTGTQQWLMRDANWSPDFPTSARKTEEKYHEEGGSEQEFDGVIAVTPTFISSLLKLTGPITVENVQFTPENLFQVLQTEVEFNYSEKGISDADRKEIIGHLSTNLVDSLFALPRSSFPALWTSFVQNVNEKQILLYLDDSVTQQLIEQQNWAGEMKSVVGDYIMVVDANLAALKTDNVMERSLHYAVSERDGTALGTLDVQYRNTGHFSKLYTRYRTYTRVYLPQGTSLLSSSGFMTGDKLQSGRATEPDVYEESFTDSSGKTHTYTVIGGFISIEPQEEGTLHLEYRLSDSVQNQIKQKQYHLYVQKQAGTLPHGLRFDLDIGREIVSAGPLDETSQIGQNSVSIETDLRQDRSFSIQLK